MFSLLRQISHNLPVGLIVVVLTFLNSPPAYSAVDTEKTKKVQFLITSDLHGRLSTSFIYPSRRRSGLLHITSIIRRERQRNPAAILIDCGDLLQGSPLVHYFNRFSAKPSDQNPFFKTFLSLKYDAVVVGNHDLAINPLFESEYLKHANFSWLGANVFRGGAQLVHPYITFNRKGLKITVIGITSPGVRMWVSAEQLAGINVGPIKGSLEKWLKQIKKKESPDLVIGAFHAGLNPFRDDINSKLSRIPPANGAKAAIGAVKGIDIAFLGHDHTLSPKDSKQGLIYVGDTPVISGGRWGEAVVSVDLHLKKNNDSWKIVKIDKKILRADQNRKIDKTYKKKLPTEYRSYINGRLPYVFGRTTRREAEKCLNQLVAIANDDKEADGTMLPSVSIYKLNRYFERNIVRRDLFHWLPYDNRAVVVPLSAREIGLIFEKYAPQTKESSYHYKSIYPRMKKKIQYSGEGKWWLDAGDFEKKYKILVSDYHHQGGGGVFTQFFINLRKPRRITPIYLRDQLFSFLAEPNEKLPNSCRFLKHSK
jgi:2',3'-cyclic-nucleotide 2'-phosphodiesterase (5'-nucleotidase family)